MQIKKNMKLNGQLMRASTLEHVAKQQQYWWYNHEKKNLLLIYLMYSNCEIIQNIKQNGCDLSAV